MATSKLLKPTNVTISIPEFTDQPDQRVNSNGLDKEADAINALSEQIANLFEIVDATSVTTADIAPLNTTSIQLVTNKNYNDYHIISVELLCGNGWCKPSLSGIVSVGGKVAALAEIYNGNSTGTRSFTVDARFVLVAK